MFPHDTVTTPGVGLSEVAVSENGRRKGRTISCPFTPVIGSETTVEGTPDQEGGGGDEDEGDRNICREDCARVVFRSSVTPVP